MLKIHNTPLLGSLGWQFRTALRLQLAMSSSSHPPYVLGVEGGFDGFIGSPGPGFPLSIPVGY